MKEIGFLFQDEMAQAFFENRKWVTRRLRGLGTVNATPDSWEYKSRNKKGEHVFSDLTMRTNNRVHVALPCPWGATGDIGWAREAFCVLSLVKGRNGPELEGRLPSTRPDGVEIRYRAAGDYHARRWRASLFMPRWAARTVRPIVQAWPERLIDITDADAKAEGLEGVIAYRDLWDRINGDGPFPATKNPWVWRIEFEKGERWKAN